MKNSLIQEGSLIRYSHRIKFNEGVESPTFRDELKEAFPDQTWRVRDSSNGGARIARFIKSLGQFMTLVGLTALLVGGVGVSNAVQSYLGGKTDTIATFKILGATGRTILITYLSQILLIASFAITGGLFVGASLPLLAGELLKDSLPIDFKLSVYVKPLILAAYYSISVALIFTLMPLGRAVQVSAAGLFRQTGPPLLRLLP